MLGSQSFRGRSEKNSVRRERGNFFFFFSRSRVCRRRQRYTIDVVKIGDKSVVDSLQKIFSYNVQSGINQACIRVASFSSLPIKLKYIHESGYESFCVFTQHEFQLIVQHLSYLSFGGEGEEIAVNRYFAFPFRTNYTSVRCV